MKTKDEKLIFRCFSCKKNYEKDFNKKLIERFANIYEFCNGDLNKFILLLRKGEILMSTGIIEKDLLKCHYPIKILFIVA